MAVRPDDRVPSARDLRLALAELLDPAAWTRADAAAFWRAAGSTAGPAVSGPVAAG
jgi:hypothetical protein